MKNCSKPETELHLLFLSIIVIVGAPK